MSFQREHDELKKILHNHFEATSSEVRNETERLLNGFKSQPDAWKYCQNFLTTTDSHYVSWFCMTIYEHIVRTPVWPAISAADRNLIKNLIFEFLVQRFKYVPSFVWKKACKALVEIAKVEWPTEFPLFFDKMAELLRSGDTLLVGLSLLTMTSEEFTSTKEDILAARKAELRALLLAQMPAIFVFLQQVLDTLLARYIQSLSPSVASSPLLFSPPKSPGVVSGIAEFDGTSKQMCEATLQCLSHFFTWVPLADVLTQPLIDTLLKLAQIHSRVATASLTCLTEALSKNFVPRTLHDFLARCMAAVCSIMRAAVEPSPAALEQTDPEFVEKTNEFVRVFVENHFHRAEADPSLPTLDFLALLFRYTASQTNAKDYHACLDVWMVILTHLHQKYGTHCVTSPLSPPPGSTSPLHSFSPKVGPASPASPPSAALFKYSEGVSAVAKMVLSRTQLSQSLTSGNAKLFKLLCSLDDAEGNRQSRSSSSSAVARDLFGARGNGDSSDGGVAVVDEDQSAESEFGSYIFSSVRVIAACSALFPDVVLAEAGSLFNALLEPLRSSLSQLKAGTAPGRPVLPLDMDNAACEDMAPNPSHQTAVTLFCVLRDLTTCLRVFSAVAGNDHPESHHKQIIDLLRCLVQVGSFCVLPPPSHPLLSEFLSSLLFTFQAHAHFLAQISAAASSAAPSSSPLPTSSPASPPLVLPSPPPLLSLAEFDSFVVPLLDLCLAVMSQPCEDAKLSAPFAAARLFHSICTTVRPKNLLAYPSIQTLCKALFGSPLHLHSMDVFRLQAVALCCAVMPSSAGSGGGNAAMFAQVFGETGCVGQLISAVQSPSFVVGGKIQTESEAGHTVHRDLLVLGDVLTALKGEPRATKQLLHSTVTPALPMLQDLFKLCVQCDAMLDTVLDLFYALVQCLKSQVGTPYIHQLVTIFFSYFSSHDVSALMNPKSNGPKILSRFLHLLQLLMVEPGTAFDSLIPNILSLCTDHLMPMHEKGMPTEVSKALFSLLFSVLMSKWSSHFFSLASMSVLTPKSDDAFAQCLAILKAILTGFKPTHNAQPAGAPPAGLSLTDTPKPFAATAIFDPDLFRSNLKQLDQLNGSRLLYQRSFVLDTGVFDAFLSTFLQVLCEKGVDMLREEIVNTVFAMVTAAPMNFELFFERFLPAFLEQARGLSQEQKRMLLSTFTRESDSPSFTKNFSRFLNDFIYFHGLTGV